MNRHDISNFGVLLIFPALFLLLCSGAQEQQKLPDISEVLGKVNAQQISLALADSALPRLRDELILFRLRGEGQEAIQAPDLEDENRLLTCLIVGAYLRAARWDWRHFMGTVAQDTQAPSVKNNDSFLREHELIQLKFAMELYLTHVNHRVRNLDAPASIVQLIDEVKQHFQAGRDNLEELPFARIDELMDTVSNQVRVFLLHDQELSQSFACGEWLANQAMLSNLGLGAKDDSSIYLHAVINTAYNLVDLHHFRQLCRKMFRRSAQQRAKQLREVLDRLDRIFPVKDRQGCLAVQKAIFATFKLLELEFPSLRTY